jgi:hypothetical protein
MDDIHYHSFETRAGNTISVFFNKHTKLLVVDIIHHNWKGGNEIVRQTLDEKQLLKHCKEQT